MHNREIEIKQPPDATDIEYLHECLDETKRDYLRHRGWKYTCNTPGAFWVWEKLHDGRVIICDESMALAFQEALDGVPMSGIIE